MDVELQMRAGELAKVETRDTACNLMWKSDIGGNSFPDSNYCKLHANGDILHQGTVYTCTLMPCSIML